MIIKEIFLPGVGPHYANNGPEMKDRLHLTACFSWRLVLPWGATSSIIRNRLVDVTNLAFLFFLLFIMKKKEMVEPRARRLSEESIWKLKTQKRFLPIKPPPPSLFLALDNHFFFKEGYPPGMKKSTLFRLGGRAHRSPVSSTIQNRLFF